MNQSFIDHQPPHNIEAEQSVLGAIFLDSDVFDLVSAIIEESDFYSERNRKIYSAMHTLHGKGTPIDLVTISTELSDQGCLEEVGGINHLTELASSVPSAANVEYYATIVKEKSLLRRLIKTTSKIMAAAYESSDDVETILYQAEKSILDISKSNDAKDFKHIEDVLIDVYQKIEDLHYSKKEVTGLPTGFVDLDRITLGFQKSDLIIIAARPSVGKTAFALNIAQQIAVRTKENVAIFSLEMSAEQLVMRMLSAEGNIESQKLRSGHLDEKDWSRLTMAMANLSRAGVYIDDTPGIRVSEIRSKCRRLMQEKGLGIIIIDYLQLMQPSGKKENRQQEISEISRSLKELARELDVPVIALSQLSRGVEQRQDKRPILSDLRESGSIEQDADVVGFLYRDDYYDKESDKKNIIEIIIAKQRNGPVGTVELAFLKNYNKFVNLYRNEEE